MIETSTEIKELTAALLRVQGAIEGVKRDGQNPHFRSKYATLENVIDTARPALQEAGIAFSQAPGTIIDGAVEVTTMLVHKSGQWMRSTLHVPLGKRDPQGVGSAITYGLRYSLMAMLGLPPTDDDGEGAMERNGTVHPVTQRRSSASLKREEVWPEMMQEIRECGTVSMLMKLRDAWSKKAAKDHWPVAWMDAAAEEFEKAEKELRDMAEREADADTFPGDVPLRRAIAQHPLNAG
jgi:hypothetical protein